MAVDGTTAIRFYGVEDPRDNGDPTYHSLPIGVARSPVAGQVDVTTMYPGQEFGSWVPWRLGDNPPFGWGWIEFLSGTHVDPPPVRGAYGEREFVPLVDGGTLAPIQPGELPLQVCVGFGAGDYSGGIVQIGMYRDGVFHVLASWEHTGAYYPSNYPAPDVDGLPPATSALVPNGGGGYYITLEANVPGDYFWTALKTATETL